MSDPSSGVPEETTDAEVHEAQEQPADEVQLDLDEEKLDKWDEVKSDYQIDPHGKPMPNIWDAGDVGQAEPEQGADAHGAEADAEQREEVNNEDAPEVFATDSGEDEQPT